MPEPTPMVFVVEDDSSVREALAGLIRSAGLNVEVFVSAHEFLARPRADAPSCLVLDVGLPDLSGLDLQARMAELHHDIPIVFITGHGDIPKESDGVSPSSEDRTLQGHPADSRDHDRRGGRQAGLFGSKPLYQDFRTTGWGAPRKLRQE